MMWNEKTKIEINKRENAAEEISQEIDVASSCWSAQTELWAQTSIWKPFESQN